MTRATPNEGLKPTDPASREINLRDGTEVRLRPIGPADRDQLLAGFELLSPNSRFQRFFAPLRSLPDHLVDQLLDTDGEDHVAIGAESAHNLEQGLIGVARLVRTPDRPNTAELSVAVVDSFQRRGLGTILLDHLLGVAHHLNITRIVAYVLEGNHAVQTLLKRFGFVPTEPGDTGTLAYEVAIPSVPETGPHPFCALLRSICRECSDVAFAPSARPKRKAS